MTARASVVRRIAMIGGTGREGQGLALRWARAGHEVVIGSRSADRATQAAQALRQRLGSGALRGATNAAAAREAEVVVLTVPYAAQREIAVSLRTELAGKILIDATVPLRPPHVGVVALPDGGSAALGLQSVLGDGVRVVSAFQNVAAGCLDDLEVDPDCDVLVSAATAADAELAIALAADAGMRAFHAGPLDNAIAAEALTSVLIALNRRYRSTGIGIRITGV